MSTAWNCTRARWTAGHSCAVHVIRYDARMCATGIDDALVQLEKSIACVNVGFLWTSCGPERRDPKHYAWKSIQRALVARFILHQVRASTKHEELDVVLAKLSVLEPELTVWLQTTLLEGTRSTRTAQSVLYAIAHRISRDPVIQPYLSAIEQRLTRSVDSFPSQSGPPNRG